MASAYEPKAVEEKWYADWLAKGHFTADPKSTKPAYSIVIPPPNVTGVLTMGHVLNNAIQDILARRKRMQGYEVLWLPGTDHAGIATQAVVERELRKAGVMKHRNDLGREKFLEHAVAWKEKHGGIIIQQLKKLGCSCDWTRERYTMDDHYVRCVLQVFVDLYKKGNIYRGKRMVNWDPASRTALSDEEVEMKELKGHLWHIKYPLLSPNPSEPSTLLLSNEFLIVATTRPETMLGDEAIAVNPSDERYRSLKGRFALLPLRNKPIRIIEDNAVDPKFGTGCVKVTPAHDPADYEMAQRHKLPLTVVIGPDGKMTDEAGNDFAGQDRFDCRKAVIEKLMADGSLLKTEDYVHNVGHSERSGAVVEPYLSEQWFLKYPSVEKSTAAIENGEIKFYPERWTKTYANWMHNIRDWCISRQLWWGHRIPVWYDPYMWTMRSFVLPRNLGDGIQITKAETSQEELDEHIRVQIECPPDPPSSDKWWKSAKDGVYWHQDPDVLDTWFSSWLWPFATMGWTIEKPQAGTPVPPELQKFYPTTDLVTGPDIIFFWVARMIMAGHEYMGGKPFANVYFTGIIRDAQGRKMSKSLGNSPDPLDLIAKYGADGLRFGLMLIAPQGQDILFDEKRCEVGRNFMNKLWNAARFIQMQRATNPPPRPENVHDHWILNELNQAIVRVGAALDEYKFNEAAKELYDFVWGDFCDWYIEASKVSSNIAVLADVLGNVLRMLHPFAPFITEELWRDMGYGGDTIQFAAWPKPRVLDGSFLETMPMVAGLHVIVTAGRQLRADYGIEPRKKVKFVITGRDASATNFMETEIPVLRQLLNAEEITVQSSAFSVSGSITPSRVTPAATIYMVGAVDAEAERKRLTKQLQELEKTIASAQAKLANKNFIERAKPEAVQGEREKLKSATEQGEKIRELLAALK